MASTKQRHTYLPLTLPSRSRYSFTDPDRMEGWVSPGPGCKEQLANGCYATARSQRDSNLRPSSHWSSALTTRLSRHPVLGCRVSRYTASCGSGTSSIALADRSCISGLQSVKFCTSVNDSDDAADDDDGENSPHQKKPRWILLSGHARPSAETGRRIKATITLPAHQSPWSH